MYQFDRVYPQSATAPITTALRQDVATAGSLTNSPLDTAQRFAVIGDTIPIVFCQRMGSVGGVFVSPAAVRFRIVNNQNSTTTYTATVLSEGCVPQVAQTDVYIGAKTGRASSVQTVCNGIAPGYEGNSVVSKQTYKKTEFYVGASGSTGISLERGSTTKSTGTGVLDVQSKTDRCTAFTASLVGKYVLRGIGNGLDGFPAYISGKTYTVNGVPDPTSPRSWQNLVNRQFITTNEISVGWLRTQYVKQNPDFPGCKSFRIVYEQPTKYNSSIYPSNETFTASSNPSETTVNSWLDKAYLSAAGRVKITSLANSYTDERDSKYIGSGTSLEVLEDNYYVEVTETTEYDYPTPEGYNVFGGSGGSFSGLTTLSATTTTATEDKLYLMQLHAFVRNGMQVTRLIDGAYGSSNLFPDLAHWCMTRTALVPNSMIDVDRLRSAAQFTSAHKLFYNGVVATAVNLREFLDRVAPYFLLRVSQVNGRYGLQPALPVTGTAFQTGVVAPTFEFNNDNVLGGSFVCSSVDAASLRPFCALMVWRDQPETGYGTLKTTEVRYAGLALDGPFEQYDMSDFCANENHAIMAGRYIVSRRRRVTHTASWQTSLTASAVNPGDIVRMTLVTANSQTGANSTYTKLFQVERVTEAPSGLVTIEASLFPVDSAGRSLVALDIVNGL